jgi:DNA/RNA-binding domain of Phe-tRNA-synthetase-like protein
LPPRAAPPSPPAAAHFYALVTRPVRTKPEGEAMLRRLRAETDRIAHPTATQTALQESRDGWRATWWPFTNPRQAENARQALARRIELEVIEF